MKRRTRKYLLRKKLIWYKLDMKRFYELALIQYNKNVDINKVVENYNKLKTVLKTEDFYIPDKKILEIINRWGSTCTLQSYIDKYPILYPPINIMFGTKSKRND